MRTRSQASIDWDEQFNPDNEEWMSDEDWQRRLTIRARHRLCATCGRPLPRELREGQESCLGCFERWHYELVQKLKDHGKL